MNWTVWKREQSFPALQKLYILNVIDEFCDDYIVPCVQAHCRI